MAAKSTVAVRFTGDVSDLKRSLDHVDGQMRGLGSKFAAFGKAAAVGLGVAAVGVFALGKSAVDKASDLSESLSKVNVVFGDGAAAVQAWSKTAADSMGMAQQQALEAAGTFGNFLIAMGSPREAAQEMSIGLVQLAADLASFNNANPDEVLLALRSGLSGEAEPLRKFGVSLSAARVEAEALAMGLSKPLANAAKVTTAGIAVEKANIAAAAAMKKHGAGSLQYRDALAKVTTAEAAFSAARKGKVPDLTAAMKAQAAYNIIQKDTALAQGDFARTSDGLANKQRILAAKFSDLQANIGQGLLPIVLAVADFFEDKLLPILSRYLPDALSAAGRFFEETGTKVAEFVTEKLQQLRDWWDEHGPAITETMKGLGEDVQSYIIDPFVELVAYIGRELLPKLGEFTTWLAKNKRVLEAFGVLVGVALVAHFTALAYAAVAAAAASAAAWAAAVGPIALMILVVGALTVATTKAIESPAFGRLLQWGIDIAAAIWDLANALGKAVPQLEALIGLAKNAAGLIPDIPFIGPSEAKENPLTGEPVDRGGSSGGSTGGGSTWGRTNNITIINPTQEPLADSLRTARREAALMGA